jgi:hypothetical protein
MLNTTKRNLHRPEKFRYPSNKFMRHGANKNILLAGLLALAYGAAMFLLNGDGRLYSAAPFHLFQADAMLSGHLSLPDSIEDLQPGLAWHNGHVQQVWGLGIGLWLMPFQAVWKLFGGQLFPDRIALGLAFALLAFYTLKTGIAIARSGNKLTGIGFIWTITLFPPLWTLTRASNSVFEVTVLYAVIVSFGILVSVVRVALFNNRLDYAVCVGLGSYAMWVRPTHIIYAVGALVICSIVVWVKSRLWKPMLAGIFVFVASCGLLAYTNQERFGSPAEFGHHLTVSSGSMVFLTRFGNPYRETPPLQAVKELGGILFCSSHVRDQNVFADDVLPGQAAFTRWRKLDVRTFDLSYAIFTVAALLFTTRRIFRGHGPGIELLPTCLAAWSVLSIAGLVFFYLYYPVMASRYLFDFAPAFAGLTGALIVLMNRFGKTALVILAGWLCGEIYFGTIPQRVSLTNEPASNRLRHTQNAVALPETAEYSAQHPPAETQIAWNGNGWSVDDTVAEDIVTLMVDRPAFVELVVGKRRDENGVPAKPDAYRAVIDGVELPLSGTNFESDQIHVRFEIPDELKRQLKQEVLFLCFSKRYELEDRISGRFLYSVRWR